jgi:uncharacterized protein YbjT (DUF2867 family)
MSSWPSSGTTIAPVGTNTSPGPAAPTVRPSQPVRRSILLCGATGLVGGECLRLLAADTAFDPVVVIGRRPLPEATLASLATSRVQQHVVDFDRIDDYAELLEVDQVICALGTTIRKAGSKDRFAQVDFAYPLAIARIAQTRGARHFLLVSSLGAEAKSRVFYSRVKGEVEDAVSALRYRSTTIVRPSLLVGDRQEFRLGEQVGRWLGLLVPGNYRPVRAADVAKVLVQAARDDEPGRRIIESREIRRIARA